RLSRRAAERLRRRETWRVPRPDVRPARPIARSRSDRRSASPLALLPLDIPAVAIALGQDLARGLYLGVRLLGDAEGFAQLIHHILVRRGGADAHRFVPRTPGALPVGVEIASRELRTRLVMRADLRQARDDRPALARTGGLPPPASPGPPPARHARTHSVFRSPGSCATMSSASPGDSCSLSPAKTASVTISACVSDVRPPSTRTR